MSRRGPTAAEIGKLGGEAGFGAVKRRPPEHYLKMAEARKKKREEKAEMPTERSFIVSPESWVMIEFAALNPIEPASFETWSKLMCGLGDSYGFNPEGAHLGDMERREILAEPAVRIDDKGQEETR